MGCYGFTKPKKIEDVYDVVNYLEWFYGEEKETKGPVRNIDTRHIITWASHGTYATLLFKNGGSMHGMIDNIYVITEKQHKLVKDVVYVLK